MQSSERPLSVVVTALAGAAAEAELVGRAQVVATGEVVAIRSLAELGELLQRLCVPPPENQ
jgi:hypothetical protein